MHLFCDDVGGWDDDEDGDDDDDDDDERILSIDRWYTTYYIIFVYIIYFLNAIYWGLPPVRP